MSILLNVKNVRCIHSASFKFPAKGLVLIRGESGSGKTTLVNSIKFALDGSLIIKNEQQPRVVLETDTLKIERTKRPSSLTVLKDGILKTDKEAQALIDSQFCLGLINQLGHDSFLASSALDRRLFLDKISGLDTEQVINIDAKFVIEQKRLEKSIDTMRALVEQLRTKIDSSLVYTPNLPELNTPIVGYRKELDEITARLANRVERERNAKLYAAFCERTRLLDQVSKLKSQEYYAQELEDLTRFKSRVLSTASLENWVATCPACCTMLTIENEKLSTCTDTCCGAKKRKTIVETAMGTITSQEHERVVKTIKQLENEQYELRKCTDRLAQITEWHCQPVDTSQDCVDAKRQQVLQALLSGANGIELTEIEYEECKLKHKNNILFEAQQASVQQLRVLESTLENEMHTRTIAIAAYAHWLDSKALVIEQTMNFITHRFNQLAESIFSKPIVVVLTTNTHKARIGVEVLFKSANNCCSFSELSGGEKSRVSIVMACIFAQMSNTKILMLDESCAGLDALNLERTICLLKSFSSTMLILLISHSIMDYEQFDSIVDV